MRNAAAAGAAAILLTLSPPARACNHVAEGLGLKVDDFHSFQSRNDQVLQHLLATETRCQEQGAALSSKVAGLAAALSCEAQKDASSLDHQLNELGAACESNFRELNSVETALHSKFNEVRSDLSEGAKALEQSKLLGMLCPKAVEGARQMVQSFSALESSIVTVEARSVDGKTHYGLFKDTAQKLHEKTAAGARNCGELASLSPSSVLSARAEPGKVPAGVSTNPASSITGTIQRDPLPAAGGTNRASKPLLAMAESNPELPGTARLLGTRAPGSSSAITAASGTTARESGPAGNGAPAIRKKEPALSLHEFGNRLAPVEGRDGPSASEELAVRALASALPGAEPAGNAATAPAEPAAEALPLVIAGELPSLAGSPAGDLSLFERIHRVLRRGERGN